MPSTTISSLPEPLSLEVLDKRLTRAWDFGGSRSRAIETALEIRDVLAREDRRVDLGTDFKIVWHATAALWDANALDEAAEMVALWRKIVEAELRETDADPTEARVWSAILSAELEHRLRRYDVAVEYGRMALASIRSMACGEHQLKRMLELAELNPITEMACAALAITIPSGRLYFHRRPTLRAQYLNAWIEDAQLILHRDLPPPFFRIHALVIQTYFAMAEQGDPQTDAEWLNRLERFDDLVRPRTPRGQATKRLRHIARARFDGNAELELAEARQAEQDLKHLARHRRTLTANRWWPVCEEPAQELGNSG